MKETTPYDIPNFRDSISNVIMEHGDHLLHALFSRIPSGFDSKRIIHNLERANLYLVNKHMTRQSIEGSKSLSKDFTLIPEDIPDKIGFIVFTEPIGKITTEKGTLPYSVALWEVYWDDNNKKNMVSLYYFADRYNPEYYYVDTNGTVYNNKYITDNGDYRHAIAGFQVLSADGISRDYEAFGRPISNIELNLTKDLYENLQSVMKSTWLFTKEEFVQISKEKIGRPRLVRKGKKIKRPTVNVITLRKTIYIKLDDNKRDYSPYDHRFPVKGHWRNQAYGPGWKNRRPIWIHEYTKGPKGAPLIVTEKVQHLKK